jgi:hypothetical protein
MSDQSPQPSSFVFPVALQPAVDEQAAAQSVGRADSWGWLELFVFSQLLWGVLLFIPGSQAYRTYIRAFPYAASLIALLACARSGTTDTAVPGARWIMAAIVLLIANLVHEETWFMSGVAQVVFQLAIAAPVFWGARAWITSNRLDRLMLLIFAANLASAGLGLLQVYYPATFLPPQFSAFALKMNPEFVSSLTYVGSGNRAIVRPPGLSDLPGGASIAGTITALLGFALAMRPHQTKIWKAIYAALAVVGITVVYLTQVRSMILMILGGMMVVALVRLRRGRIVQSGWIAAAAATLVVGSFVWAVTLGGESVHERFVGLVDSGVVQSYQENRGIFLDYTFKELLYQYPLGAGVGRWGMMTAYFGDSGNWQHPALWVEIQPTGWLFDGGILMWIFYPAALLVATRYSYKQAVDPGGTLNDYAEMILVMQLFTMGLCFTGPVFNTQVGIMFWLTTAMLVGAARTVAIQAWNADAEADAEAEEDALARDGETTGEIAPAGAGS